MTERRERPIIRSKVSPDVHALVTARAHAAGVSAATWCGQAIALAVGQPPHTAQQRRLVGTQRTGVRIKLTAEQWAEVERLAQHQATTMNRVISDAVDSFLSEAPHDR
jgi:hypothetical protein